MCWVLIALGLIGSIVAPAALFSIFWWILVILVVNEILRRHLRSQQQALLWSMSIAVEKTIPLVPTIEAFARDRSGVINTKARKVAALLKSGVSLPDALEKVPGILPLRVLPMIRVGYESGTLAKSLRQAVMSRDLLSVIWNSLFTKLLYIFLLIFFGTSILLFMMLKIVPSYEKIFRDFGGHLPAVTIALINTSHFIVNYWYIFLPFYLLILGFILHLMSCYFGWASIYFPGMTRLMRRRHAAAIFDSLALSAESNQPLGKCVATLAEHYPEASVRRKLYRVEHEINQGADWSESLCQSGLIKQCDQAVLQAAQRVGNLPWAMREMADSNRRRLAYRLNALVQLAYPPVILCLGLCVMFIVVAMFSPLITLVMRLVGQ